jgi:catechol 2,3-dioxygenase-like lactoylglutathione lyase family enzyme
LSTGKRSQIDNHHYIEHHDRIDRCRCYQEVVVARFQLALNVSDIDEAIGFYSRFFGAEPAKRQPGYANFAIADPPLKLVLIETSEQRGRGVAGALNQLGVEVESPAEVQAATTRLAEAGMTTEVQESTTCCYAVQDKVWVSDPDHAVWEVYTVLTDAPAETGLAGDGSCCTTSDPVAGRVGWKPTSSSCC